MSVGYAPPIRLDSDLSVFNLSDYSYQDATTMSYSEVMRIIGDQSISGNKTFTDNVDALNGIDTVGDVNVTGNVNFSGSLNSVPASTFNYICNLNGDAQIQLNDAAAAIYALNSDVGTRATAMNTSLSGALNFTPIDNVGFLNVSMDTTLGGESGNHTLTLRSNILTDGVTVTPANLATVDTTVSLQQLLNGKQPTINTGARLNANLIANGSVSNTAFQYIANLNSDAQTALSSQSSAITSLNNSRTADQATLAGHTSAIATHTSAISTNTTDIATNASAIETNTSDIAAHTTDIATNASAIAANTTDISTNTSDIASHTTDIATNASAIAANTTAIATNASAIATNASAIAANTTDISTNTSAIAANTTDIAANATDIAANATDIATNATDIAANAADIATNATNIATNTTDIATNAADIATNASAIATNSTAISSLNTSRTADQTTLSSHTSSISSLNSSISSHASAITANSDAIALCAPIISPSFSGTPTVPTASTATNTTQIASCAFVNAAISNLIDGSPSALNTLNELAAALGNDPNLSTTIATALATKAPLSSPAFVSNPTAPTQTAGDNSTKLATTAYVATAVAGNNNDTVLTGVTTVGTELVNGNFTVYGNTQLGNQNTDTLTICGPATFQSNIIANSVTITPTELSYVHNVTSSIQSQISSKAPITSPTFLTSVGLPATTITGNLTANSTAITPTELSYVSGVTSAIQSQIAAKANLASPTLTGTPLCPTASTATNTTQIASTAYVQANLGSYAVLASPTFTGTLGAAAATLTGLFTGVGATLSGLFTAARISESISTATVSSNAISVDYSANNSIIYVTGLSANTNFSLALTNINPNTASYKTFTVTLMIDTTTYKAYCNSLTVNSTSRTLRFPAAPDLSSLTPASGTCVMQQISITYTSSTSVPFCVVSNVTPFF